MDFGTATELSLWFIVLTGLIVPLWIVFIPPRPVQKLPILYRPLIATIGTVFLFYVFYYIVLTPYAQYLGKQNPETTYCGIFVWQPNKAWPGILVISSAFFGILLFIRLFRRPKVT